MDCNKVVSELVFLFIDEEMGTETLVAYQQHISRCPHCEQQTHYTRRLIATVRRCAGRQAAPDHLRRRILAGVRARQESVRT